MSSVRCDVLVVGGGIAGMSAALAAARRGKQTLLLERSSRLGGTLRAGLNFPVCGLFDSEANLLNDGLSRNVFEAIDVQPESMGQVYIWPCPTTKLLELFSTRIAAEKNLTVKLKTPVSGVTEQDKEISRVLSDGLDIRPRVVVDCSGAVVNDSSAEKLLPENEMLGGYSIRLQGLEPDPMLPLKVPYALQQESDLPHYLHFTAFSPPDGLKLAVPSNVGPKELERDIKLVCQSLAKRLPAFENVRVGETSPYVLQREGTRLHGEYIITKKDVLSGARFNDAVAKCAWPIEYWDPEKGQQFEYLAGGAYYEIPLRCLKSRDLENLFAAGRYISATSEALASARVMGTCIATGEAAGQAAAELCS